MLGQVISHYRLERELGRGSFGVVYEAADVDDPAFRVAVKVMHPSLANDADFVRSLRRERTLLADLDHAGLVRFRDLVSSGGTTAIILELLDGSDLHTALAGGALPVDTVVAILEQALDTLAYAHAAGVVHRDIKPANLFWTARRRLKFLDFGLAKALEGSVSSTTSQFTGTYSYASAEVWEGKPALPPADVYALGLVAWELLAGRAACPEGPLPVKMTWHVGSAVDDVREHAPTTPPWLAGWIARCVERGAARRPGNGAEALALFRSLREGVVATPGTSRAQPPAPAPPPWLPPRRSHVGEMSVVRPLPTASEPVPEAPPPPAESPPVSSPTVAPPAAAPPPSSPPSAPAPAAVGPRSTMGKLVLAPLLAGGLLLGLVAIVATGGAAFALGRASGGEAQAAVPAVDEASLGTVLATVDGVPVGSVEFMAAAERKSPASGDRLSMEEKRDVLDGIVEEKLLYREGIRKGVDRDPKVQKVVVNTLLRADVYATVKNSDFTDEMLQAYYEQHRSEFIVPEKVQIRRLLVKVSEDRTDQAARAEAQRLRELILRDPSSFKDLAASHSEDPYRRRGGDVGFVSREGKPGLDQAIVDEAFRLPTDAVSTVFKTSDGYNVISVVARREAVERSFEQMKGSVLRKVKNDKLRELYEAYVGKLRDVAKIEVRTAALAAIEVVPSARPSPTEVEGEDDADAEGFGGE